MDDTLSVIIGIALAAILMFLFPLMTMADRNDDVSQLGAKIATAEFANEVIQTGKITPENYNKLIQTLGSTGNTYNIEIEAKILDENSSRQITESTRDTTRSVGENVYYSIFTTQILDTINSNNGNNIFYLKEGDIISVSVKNQSQTIAQQLKNFFYKVVGQDSYVISATGSGLVTVTGK